MSIGLSCNFYNEINALPGLLETCAHAFDDVVFIDSGPGGKRSDDGSIELLEKWGVRIVSSSIDAGFGVVRTQCIRESRADFVMVLDADERFHPVVPALRCAGEDSYQRSPYPDLVVTKTGVHDQMATLKQACGKPGIMAVRMHRRHWLDFSWKRPCQNWHMIPDHQLRVVKNDQNICFDPNTRMHEILIDSRTGESPRCATFRSDDGFAAFIDHYNPWWNKFDADQISRDAKTYHALNNNKTP